MPTLSPSCRYVIPARELNTTTQQHLFALSRLYHLSNGRDYEAIVIASENSLPDFKTDSTINLYTCNGNIFEKLAAAARLNISTQFVNFSTSDDLSVISLDDIAEMHARKCAVGIGNFLLCRPINDGRFRLYRGWTHFREYMGSPPTKARFKNFVAEGPHSVWACYDTQYFISLGEMVTELLSILHPHEINLIEDIINVVNLTASDYFCRNTNNLRFLDGNYGKRSNFIPSWHAVQSAAASGALPAIALIIKNHLRRASKMGFCTEVLSVSEIIEAVVNHTDGYRRARSRKWRDWVDVEWCPYDPPGTGVVLTGDDNPYLIKYVWAGNAPITESFPTSSWLSDKSLVSFIQQVPTSIWKLHQIGDS